MEWLCLYGTTYNEAKKTEDKKIESSYARKLSFEEQRRRETEQEEKELKDFFETLDEDVKNVPFFDFFSNRKKDVKFENGFEIHNKYYLLPNIELTQDLHYRITQEHRNLHSKKRHKIATYEILKGINVVEVKITMEIDKQ